MTLRLTCLFLSIPLLAACGSETKTLGKIGADQPGIDISARQRSYWPTASWQVSGQYESRFTEVDQYLFNRTGDEKNRMGIRTDCVVIVKNGVIVFEKYARGYSQGKKHLTWSVSKSFVNALYGIAIKEGRVKLNDSAVKYYPQLNKEEKQKITIQDLLQMSSGLYWNEGYESSPLKSSVIAMLYTRGRSNMAAFAARQDVIAEPGKLWYYSSGTSNLLMAILRNITGKENYKDYPWQKLFSPLGMKSVTWEADQTSNYIGSSYLYATARDLARFGFLYLNDGTWQGQAILPEGWVKFTTEMAPGFYFTELDLNTMADDNPGAHWWLNKGAEDLGLKRPWPALPKDTFAARGHWGQLILVVPSHDLVIVRLADDRDKSFSINKLGRLILGALAK